MGTFPRLHFRFPLARVAAALPAGAAWAKQYFAPWQTVNHPGKTFSQILILLEEKTNG
jgi:hypothetical protein